MSDVIQLSGSEHVHFHTEPKCSNQYAGLMGLCNNI